MIGLVMRFVTKHIIILPNTSTIRPTQVVNRLESATLSRMLARGMDMMNMVRLSEKYPQLSI